MTSPVKTSSGVRLHAGFMVMGCAALHPSYLLKNLEAGDLIVLSYKGDLYTYKLIEKRVVKPSEISYVQPISGERKLILQTCWPPGQTTERLLIIADLIDRQSR